MYSYKKVNSSVCLFIVYFFYYFFNSFSIFFTLRAENFYFESKLVFFLNMISKIEFNLILLFIFIGVGFFLKFEKKTWLFSLSIFFSFENFLLLQKKTDVYVNSFTFNIKLLNGFFLLHPLCIYIFYACLWMYIYIMLQHIFKKIENNKYLTVKKLYFFLRICLIFIISSVILGSWWALQEVSWGGWWNWDIVELINLIYVFLFLLFFHFNKIYFNSFRIIYKICFSFIFVISFIFFVRYNMFVSLHSFLSSNSSNQYYIILIFFYTLIFIKFSRILRCAVIWQKKLNNKLFVNVNLVSSLLSLFQLLSILSVFSVFFVVFVIFFLNKNYQEYIYILKYIYLFTFILALLFYFNKIKCILFFIFLWVEGLFFFSKVDFKKLFIYFLHFLTLMFLILNLFYLYSLNFFYWYSDNVESFVVNSILNYKINILSSIYIHHKIINVFDIEVTSFNITLHNNILFLFDKIIEITINLFNYKLNTDALFLYKNISNKVVLFIYLNFIIYYYISIFFLLFLYFFSKKKNIKYYL